MRALLCHELWAGSSPILSLGFFTYQERGMGATSQDSVGGASMVPHV